jgi:hypothetical protein
MIAMFPVKGNPVPIKFRFANNENEEIVKVDKILETDGTIFYGGSAITYKCKSLVNEMIKDYEVMYKVPEHKWYYLNRV